VDRERDIAVLSPSASVGGEFLPASIPFANREPMLGERLWWVAFEDYGEFDDVRSIPYHGYYRGRGPDGTFIIDGATYWGYSGGPIVIDAGAVVGFASQLGILKQGVKVAMTHDNPMRALLLVRAVGFGRYLSDHPKKP